MRFCPALQNNVRLVDIEMTSCRHFPDYPNCTCDPVSCVMLRSTANPAGLESIGGGSIGHIVEMPKELDAIQRFRLIEIANETTNYEIRELALAMLRHPPVIKTSL